MNGVKGKMRTFEREGEDLLKKANKLCEKEGVDGWKLAQTEMLRKRTVTPELKEAIEFVMLEYKPDYFRPALLSLCSKAVGGTSESTLSIAASLVLLGRAIGVHDDIIDQSRAKNRRPTVQGKFGKNLALVLSDVLLFTGFTSLRKAFQHGMSTSIITSILGTIEEIWFEQSEGEVLELKSRRRMDLTPQECLDKIRMRASELEAITRIGGILGCGSQGEIKALGEFGRLLGTMSILRDEIIDMLELRVLKHRIRKESLPIPLVYALQHSTSRQKILPRIAKERLTTLDLKEILKASEEAEGLNSVAKLIMKFSREASSCVETLEFKNKELKLLASSIRIAPKDWKPLVQTMQFPSSKNF